jgi:flavin reductase (DIM6/NTAB) family NADH-FMN oxidoreductase RutF
MMKQPLSPRLDPTDARIFRRIMSRFATGITVVTTEIDGQVYGMTANAYMAGSLDPPLCVVSIGNSARMAHRLRTSRHFGVSFLREDQQWLSQHFSGKPASGREPEFRFFEGTPVLEQCLAALTTRVESTATCGDHTLFIGEIFAMTEEGGRPLLFSASKYAKIGFADELEDIAPPEFW